MRRTNRFMVFLSLAVSLIAACSGPADMDPPPEIAVLDKPGAAPYPLSEGESYVLEAFGMRGRSQLISFCAPSGASGLEANVYLLGDDGAWENIGGGQISMGEEGGTLAGVFALELLEDYAVGLHITAEGRASYETDPISLEREITGSSVGFLRQYEEMELGEELPVALMLYDSGTRMELQDLEAFFEPEKLAELELVQAMTLKFTEDTGK